MRDNKVQSVTRAIHLLTLLTDQQSGMTVGSLAAESGLHKSTVSRLIMTMEASGVIQRVGKPPAVRIAPEFAQRFSQLTQPSNLQTVSRPFLEAVSEKLGEAAGLALPENDQAVFVDQVSPNLAIQVKDWTGSRFPLHTVSPGRLFLAHRAKQEQDHYLSRPLAAYTKNTTTDPSRLRQLFEEIKKTGVAWIFDEFADGISAVAAPIRNRGDTIIGALVVFAPSFRFPDPDKIEEINLIMLDFAARCSAEMQSQDKNNG